MKKKNQHVIWTKWKDRVITAVVAALMAVFVQIIPWRSILHFKEYPSSFQPDLRISMVEGNVFVPVNDQQVTGIFLDTRIKNAGPPSTAKHWKLSVIPKGQYLPTRARIDHISGRFEARGDYYSRIILPDQLLDERAATEAIPNGAELGGLLLFYIPLTKSQVLNNSTILELSVEDINDKRCSVKQYAGSWIKR